MSRAVKDWRRRYHGDPPDDFGGTWSDWAGLINEAWLAMTDEERVTEIRKMARNGGVTDLSRLERQGKL